MKVFRIASLCLSLVLLLGMILPAGVSAEKWVTVAENDSQKIEVDDDSLAMVDNKRRVQCLMRTTTQNNMALSLVKVDIQSVAFAIGPTELFDKYGGLVSTTPGDLASFQQLAPNTLGMQLFYFVQAYHDVMVYPNPKR